MQIIILHFNNSPLNKHKLGFTGGSEGKNLPAVCENQVPFLGKEDLLEKRMTTHSSILAWRILWTEGPGGLQSMGSQRIGHDCMTSTLLNGANTFFVATISREI